jgi:hypothetical protein
MLDEFREVAAKDIVKIMNSQNKIKEYTPLHVGRKRKRKRKKKKRRKEGKKEKVRSYFFVYSLITRQKW